MRCVKNIEEKVKTIFRAINVLKKRNDNTVYLSAKLNGSLGDYIVTLAVIEKMFALCNNMQVDIYVPKNKEMFARAVYHGHTYIGGFYPDRFHERYSYAYDAAIKITHFVTVTNYNEIRLGKKSKKLLEIIKGYKATELSFSAGVDTEYCKFIQRCNFWGLNRYTALGHRGVMDIEKKVNICIDEAMEEKFKKWQGDIYLTTNYGVDMVTVKLWPQEYMENLLGMIKKSFPNIKILELGASNAPRLKNVDEYVFGEDLELIKYILKGSILHIDCEGGLVHLASQLGTRCAVVAGPTPIWYYGYEQNINIVSKVCSDCEGVTPDWYKNCVLGDINPRCMYSIKPKHVYDCIYDFLEEKQGYQVTVN